MSAFFIFDEKGNSIRVYKSKIYKRSSNIYFFAIHLGLYFTSPIVQQVFFNDDNRCQTDLLFLSTCIAKRFIHQQRYVLTWMKEETAWPNSQFSFPQLWFSMLVYYIINYTVLSFPQDLNSLLGYHFLHAKHIT